MPNFWNKTTQYFDEAFNDCGTKDQEFLKLINEVSPIEEGTLHLKNYLASYAEYTEKIADLHKNISGCIGKIYPIDSPYYNLGQSLQKAHKDIHAKLMTYRGTIGSMVKKTSEWPGLFKQVRDRIHEWEESRKVYDHYDDKYEKIIKKHHEKKQLSKKDLDYKESNSTKYRKATNDHIACSEKNYNEIIEILNRRYDCINPVLNEFYKEEKIRANDMTTSYTPYVGLEEKFILSKYIIPKKEYREYDPCESIRKGKVVWSEKKLRKEKREQQKEIKKEDMQKIHSAIRKSKLESRQKRSGTKNEPKGQRKTTLTPQNIKIHLFSTLSDNIEKNIGLIKKVDNDEDKICKTESVDSSTWCSSVYTKEESPFVFDPETDIFKDLF